MLQYKAALAALKKAQKKQEEERQKRVAEAASEEENRAAETKAKAEASRPERLKTVLGGVLKELRAQGEMSEAFVARVSKRDAPDYYDVIKTPMDLALMGRKLQRGDYAGKAAFERDLALMFSNCREYNTDQTSIYLMHAADLEDYDRAVLAPISEDGVVADEGATDGPGSTDEPSVAVLVDYPISTFESAPAGTTLPLCPPTELGEGGEEEYWIGATADFREWQRRFQMREESLPFGDRPALLRRGGAGRNDPRTALFEPVSGEPVFPEFTPLVAAMPAMPQLPASEAADAESSEPAPKRARRERAAPPNDAYYAALRASLAEIAHVNNMRQLLRDMERPKEEKEPAEAPTTVVAGIHVPPNRESLVATPVDLRQATASLGQSVGLILSHSGFDGVTKPAFAVLSDLASEFLRQFGANASKLWLSSRGSGRPNSVLFAALERQSHHVNGVDPARGGAASGSSSMLSATREEETSASLFKFLRSSQEGVEHQHLEFVGSQLRNRLPIFASAAADSAIAAASCGMISAGLAFEASSAAARISSCGLGSCWRRR